MTRVGRFFFDKRTVHPRQQQRLGEIIDFFEDEDVVRSLLAPIARQQYEISLRLLDYTMTNWAKKKAVLLSIKATQRSAEVPWTLFSLYKDWLRFYRRRGFDPFRRRERIFFDVPSEEAGEPPERLQTTVAQLNFLRWAKLYGILDYVLLHKQEIEEDMVRTFAESKRRRLSNRGVAPSSKARREELSRAPSNKCLVCSVQQEIRFEVLDKEAEEGGSG